MFLIVAMSMTTASAQTPASTTAAGRATGEKAYRAPRTPWGDPDFTGIYSNAFEARTPLERPKEFEGRRLEDIKGDELLLLRKAAHEAGLVAVAGGLHGPENFWQNYYDLEKGSQAWLIVDPPDGKIPPQTAEGRSRNAVRAEARRNSGRGGADGPEDRSLWERCVTRGLPGSMMPTYYGNHYEFYQGPGYVAIRYEMVHETRVIPLSGNPHAGKSIRMYMGDPRGRWEGETLVVETTNFTDRTPFQGSSENLRLTERFTRIARDKMKWSLTVDDPTTWVRPWTFTMPLTTDPTQPIYEYGCHEGNSALTNILSAGRAEDKLFEEYAKKGFNVPRPSIPTGDESEEPRQR
jgi:hypothetical protein